MPFACVQNTEQGKDFLGARLGVMCNDSNSERRLGQQWGLPYCRLWEESALQRSYGLVLPTASTTEDFQTHTLMSWVPSCLNANHLVQSCIVKAMVMKRRKFLYGCRPSFILRLHLLEPKCFTAGSVSFNQTSSNRLQRMFIALSSEKLLTAMFANSNQRYRLYQYIRVGSLVDTTSYYKANGSSNLTSACKDSMQKSWSGIICYWGSCARAPGWQMLQPEADLVEGGTLRSLYLCAILYQR